MSTLTAIVPVWDDYVGYLPACLEAIRAQGVPVHVVVVDNASATPLPELDADVTVLRTQARVSAGAARNLGLAHAETPFVVFADADDLVLPGAWPFLLGRLAADTALVAAATQLWWVSAQSHERRPARSPRPHVYRHLNGRRRAFSLYMALRMALPTTTATIFRTDAVRDAGGYGDANLAEDWALAAAIALRGRVEQHARPGADVLVHQGSLFNRTLSRSQIERGMWEVRERLRRDPCTPRWLRLALGPIGTFHRLKAAASAARPALGGV